MIPLSGRRITRVSSKTCRSRSASSQGSLIAPQCTAPPPLPLTSARPRCEAAGVDDRAIDRGGGVVEWVHICERCGERMEEQKCKIVCARCGLTRDCADP